jgi:hypothetical protein
MNWRRLGIVLLGLAMFGAIKLPFERQLTHDFRQAHFFLSQLNLDVRAQTTQMGFVAALSGVRAPVADLVWVKTYDAFADTNWGRLKVLMDAATTLAPRSTMFWDNASWQMAWNANVSALHNPNQPREVLRVKAAKEYVRLGEDYLLRGIAFNPDRAKLFDSLGMLYSQRMKDHCKAAWAYFEAAKRPDAMGYDYRFALYELAQCPGHEAETLKLLQDLYQQGPQERTVTSLKLLDQLQKKLNVPKDQQIDIRKDLEEATPKPPPALLKRDQP